MPVRQLVASAADLVGLAPRVILMGPSYQGGPVEAELRAGLARDIGVPAGALVVESGGLTTRHEAALAARRMQETGGRRILLVTGSQHMRRARLAFEAAGFRVIPAATGYTTRYRLTVPDFLPDARALRDSALFFHEVIGTVWYRVRLFWQG